MSKFDDLIVSWRKEMSSAGIGPGPVRDELECHLRDGYDSRVRGDMDPATAFADAAAKLGAPKALRQEYNTAVTRWTRVKRFLGRRVELFPTDMRLCAWAAFPIGVFGIYGAIQNLYVNRILFSRPEGSYSGIIFIGVLSLLLLLVSTTGLLGAVRYLRRPSYSPARNLVLFWVSNFWFYGVILLMLVRASSNGWLSSNGQPILSTLPSWPLCLSITVALVSYHDWKKRLIAALSKPTV